MTHWLDMDPSLGVPPPPNPWDSSDKRRTERNRRLLKAGVHPATRLPLRDDDKTCGSCSHLKAHQRSKRYYKCAVAGRTTHGPGTDIRISWPACVLWEAAS